MVATGRWNLFGWKTWTMRVGLRKNCTGAPSAETSRGELSTRDNWHHWLESYKDHSMLVSSDGHNIRWIAGRFNRNKFLSMTSLEDLKAQIDKASANTKGTGGE